MDCAAPRSLLWWMARHCVRLLTALAIFAAALGATTPASASPAPAAQTTAVSEHAAVDQVSVESPDTVVPEPEPVTVAAVHQDLVEPASAHLAAVGQRAPPVG